MRLYYLSAKGESYIVAAQRDDKADELRRFNITLPDGSRVYAPQWRMVYLSAHESMLRHGWTPRKGHACAHVTSQIMTHKRKGKEFVLHFLDARSPDYTIPEAELGDHVARWNREMVADHVFLTAKGFCF